MAAVRVHVDEDGQFSVRTAHEVKKGDILVEFGGEIHDVIRHPDSRPTNWFLAIFGFHQHLVLDGARRGKWPLSRYLDEKKVGSFVNSSRNVPDINNYTDANAEIDWEMHVTPEGTRAILRAKDNISENVEILWNYPWV